MDPTGISLFQINDEDKQQPRSLVEIPDKKNIKFQNLPDYYTYVPPVSLKVSSIQIPYPKLPEANAAFDDFTNAHIGSPIEQSCLDESIYLVPMDDDVSSQDQVCEILFEGTQTLNSLHYQPENMEIADVNCSSRFKLPQTSMFALPNAIKEEEQWIDLVTQCLPYQGRICLGQLTMQLK